MSKTETPNQQKKIKKRKFLSKKFFLEWAKEENRNKNIYFNEWTLEIYHIWYVTCDTNIYWHVATKIKQNCLMKLFSLEWGMKFERLKEIRFFSNGIRMAHVGWASV